jgi:subtilisin family serine protease
MPRKSTLQQFVLLPAQGMQVFSSTSPNPALGRFLVDLAHLRESTGAPPTFNLPEEPAIEMRVLDSIHEDGAKLVEMSPESVSGLRAQHPGLRLVPVVYYYPTIVPRPAPESGPKVAATRVAVKITLKVVSQHGRSPIARAQVVAFTDFVQRIGLQGVTNSKGEVSFSFGVASKKLQRLYIFPEKSFWPVLKRNITLTSGMQIALPPIDLAYTDALRHFYGNSSDDAGANIKVSVIDTGIAAHPDLLIDGGQNTVTGEDPNDFGDNGAGHGTHVAGIIAARGKPPSGIRGLAPAVVLRSYRVFGKNNPRASNFAIAKAIDRAWADGCDLINMSLGGGDPDEVLQDAIADARAHGTLVIVAAGNDGRQPVSFPASDSLSLAVSALGRRGTFPGGTTQTGDVAAPYGKDRMNFIAAFSNIGPEIDLTAPGEGIISTFPGGYAVLDGTSMACPAVTGVAARLLAARADIFGMDRDQARSDAIAKALLQGATSLGFEPIYEGQGLPQ